MSTRNITENIHMVYEKKISTKCKMLINVFMLKVYVW